MTILSIETSSANTSVALLDALGKIHELSFIAKNKLHEVLFEKISELISGVANFSTASIEKIIVGCGPGSYTGTRIGIAAAQGLRLGSGKDLVALPSMLREEFIGKYDKIAVACNPNSGADGKTDHLILDTLTMSISYTKLSSKGSDNRLILSQVEISPSAEQLIKYYTKMPAKIRSKVDKNVIEPIYFSKNYK